MKKNTTIVYLCIYCLLFSCKEKKGAENKAINFNFKKEVGFIGTNDSLQSSLYLKEVNDTTLHYSLHIIKNWRYDWLEKEGIVILEKDNALANNLNLSSSQCYFYRDAVNKLNVCIGYDKEFLSAIIGFDYKKEKRVLSIEHGLGFTAK